jgi:hypothetical protein
MTIRPSLSIIARLVPIILGLGLVIALLLAPKPWAVELSFSQKVPMRESIPVGLWWAGLINALLFFALAATSGWWIQPLSGSPQNTRPGDRFTLPRYFFGTVLGAMLVFAILGAMRLPMSLWDDEEYCTRKATLGTYRVRESGEVKFKQASWQNTLWYYQMPANHMLQTVLSRLSSSAWRGLARPGGLQLSETALRLPSYLAAVFSIGTLALLLARLGFPEAGALAAWLLAIHPWMLRLGSEARGYPFIFLFIPLTWLLAMRAIRMAGWRNFAALAAAEFAMLYVWPATAITVVVLNIAVLAGILLRWQEGRPAALARWLVTGSLAADILLALSAPCVLQLVGYLHGAPVLDFGTTWLKSLGSLLLTGSQWSESGLEVSPYLELYPRFLVQPAFWWTIIVVAAVLPTLGGLQLARTGFYGGFTVAIFLVPAIFLYTLTRWRDGYLHEWYLSFVLPGLLAFTAIGATTLFAILGRRLGQRRLPAALAALLVAAFFSFTNFERTFLLRKSPEPFRESVLLTRPTLDPNSPANRDILTASWLFPPEIYDPRVHVLENAAEMFALMREADERNIPLFINNGYDFNNHDLFFPELARIVKNPAFFQPIATLKGLEPVFDREIHCYRNGSSRGLNP